MQSKNKKILITGASGFLGNNIYHKLLEMKDYDIMATSKNGLIKDNIKEMDLGNLDSIIKVLKEFQPNIILHAGAVVNLSRDYDIARRCFDSNIYGTLNLLEGIKRTQNPEKLIFTSTEEVYGSDKVPYKEGDTVNPPSAYAISKIAGENLCKNYGKELGFSVMVFRIATMYGFGGNESRLIPSIIIKALSNETINLNSGLKKRDYIYIDDAVDALVSGIKKNISTTNYFCLNLGGGNAVKLRDLVDIIIKHTHSASNIRYGILPDRLLEADIWQMDIASIYKLLAWKPKISLDEGLAITCDNYKKLLLGRIRC